MRNLFCFFIILTSVHVFAGQLNEKQMIDFMENKKPCIFTVAHIANPDSLADTSPDQKSAFEGIMRMKKLSRGDLYSTVMICVYNGIINEGTPREKQGCTVSEYDPNKNSYPLLYSKNPENLILPGIKCDKDAILKLLNQKGGWSNRDLSLNRTVWESFIEISYPFYGIEKVIRDKYGVGGALLSGKEKAKRKDH